MIWTILEVIYLLAVLTYIVLSMRELKKLRAENLALKADETHYIEDKRNDTFYIFKEVHSAKDGKVTTVQYTLRMDYIKEKATLKKVEVYNEPMVEDETKPEPLFDETLLQQVNKNSGIDKDKLPLFDETLLQQVNKNSGIKEPLFEL